MFTTGITGAMEGISPHSITRTIRTDNESPFSQIMDVIEIKIQMLQKTTGESNSALSASGV